MRRPALAPALILALFLAGCGVHITDRPRIVALTAPSELRHCPPGTEPPLPPPVPRTVEQVLAWAPHVQRAWLATERARAECADRLRRLNDMIGDGR